MSDRRSIIEMATATTARNILSISHGCQWLDPVDVVSNTRVNPKFVLFSTPNTPRYDAIENSRLGLKSRATTITLARVLAALNRPSAPHVSSDGVELVHLVLAGLAGDAENCDLLSSWRCLLAGLFSGAPTTKQD